MPRVAKYNRNEALAKAVSLFWANGYHGTSLKQLEQALDMRPGSLYAAFGNKQSLFLEALNAYADELVSQLEGCLADEPSSLSALKAFIRQLILCNADSMEPPARACMIVKTLLEVRDEDEPLGSRVNELLADVEELFEDLLRRAQREGELRADVQCDRLARLLQVQVMGARTFAQRRVSNQSVESVVEDIEAMIDSYRVRH
ncbi:TetR/AcrR family transcriptional regulator [Marinimicrobium sp. ARAG 43.8]|uniref:TetR/AcrR family transcriptional regulator n=1 Tax=Marinimicrobium sp. ARAG 43.8 TaxID=3418719 RepID=UPI003CF3FD8C